MQQGKVKQRLREPTKQLVTKEEEIKITNQAISHLEEAMCWGRDNEDEVEQNEDHPLEREE